MNQLPLCAVSAVTAPTIASTNIIVLSISLADHSPLPLPPPYHYNTSPSPTHITHSHIHAQNACNKRCVLGTTQLLYRLVAWLAAYMDTQSFKHPVIFDHTGIMKTLLLRSYNVPRSYYCMTYDYSSTSGIRKTLSPADFDFLSCCRMAL